MGDEPLADDVVEQGGRRAFLPSWRSSRGAGWRPSRGAGWRPSRGAGVLAVAALIVGLAAGYAAGDRHAHGSAALPKPAGTTTPNAVIMPMPNATFSFAGSPALTQDTGACSAQVGRELQLGVQITNQSAAPLTLQTVRAVLPMGGLKQVTQQWAPCGALPAALIQANVLQPGASAWLTATFKVQLRCPGPLPVQFTVGYTGQGHSATASLPGFPDLSQVPYSGCATH